MPKRPYILAIACHLAIPAVVFGGGMLFVFIDPELARGHADYVRNYQWLELARMGVFATMACLVVALWIACCYLVLESRQRALPWLSLAAAGPFGFTVMAMLADKAPTPDDHYQQFLARLKIYWRVALEIALFVALWSLAYEIVVLKRELMIAFQSFRTGTPVEAIVAQQTASSGMYAFGEGLQQIYLVVLLYLLWPVLFNLAGRLFGPRPLKEQ